MDDDPYTWSTDQVVECFCRARNLWSDRPNSRLPEPVTFEATLRDAEIDGAILLDNIDFTTLKSELNIHSIPVRSTIVYGIEKLRHHSPRFISHYSTTHAWQPQAQNNSFSLAQNVALGTALLPLNTPPAETHFLLQPQLPPTPRELLPDEQSSNVLNLRTGEVVHGCGSKKRRRLELGTPIAPIPSRSNTYFESEAFLGRQKARLDDVFFASPSPTTKALEHKDDVSRPEDDFGFVQSSDTTPAGRRSFYKHRLQYMLRHGPVQIDSHRAVRHPYPERLVKQGSSKSSTVFTLQNGRVSIAKKNALFLDADSITQDKVLEQNGQWDYLVMKWQPRHGTDEILPLYEESGSENDYAESLLDEIEDEEAEAPKSSGKRDFALADVIQIVNDAIDCFSRTWRESKLPQRELSAWTTWKKRSRGVVLATQHELENLQTRLNKLKKNLVEEQWTNEKSLRSTCSVLQPTVYDINNLQWKLSLWSKARPQRHLRHAQAVVPRKEIKQSDESGEDLDSDTESFDGFVDIDDEVSDMLKVPVTLQASTTGIDSIFRLTTTDLRTVYSRSSSPQHQYGPPNKSDAFMQDDDLTLIHADDSDSDDSVLGKVELYHSERPEVSKPSEFIDLTKSSPSPSKPRSLQDQLQGSIDYRIAPEDSSEEQIEAWDWTNLDETSDIKRMMMKLLHEMDAGLRKNVEEEFLNAKNRRLEENIQKALRSLRIGRDFITDISPESPRNNALFMSARLWICWDDARHVYRGGEIDAVVITRALKLTSFKLFFNFMKKIIDVGDGTSDDESEDYETKTVSPRKARKHKVIKDRLAQKMRSQAHERRNIGADRERAVLELQSSGLTELDNRVIINVTKSDSDNYIYLNPAIASKIKPHQITGIRFMWREIVVSSSDTGQGCLLAHCMGLGKTMQTISLLVTIAESAMSYNPNIVDQIPAALRESRTLVICPAVLIGNWKDEFVKWRPRDSQNIGEIFSVTAGETDRAQRLQIIVEWHSKGGVLIMSYEMFQRLLQPPTKPDTDQEQQRVLEKEHETLRKYLLQRPNIVVADEAHRFKNKDTKLAQEVQQFRTKTRIALTGSPLANALVDYYAMIDWVAPGYLGDAEEFRQYYEEPIKNGLYADSTPYEQRRSLKKLRVLKHDIDPKIDRADITVLQSVLTPKTEFVIKLPLMPVQRRLYSAFLKLAKSEESSSNTAMFSWMALLGNVCNHPSVFARRLLMRIANTREPKEQKGSENDGGAGEDDLSNLSPSLSQKMLQKYREIVSDERVEDPLDPNLSNKLKIIVAILTEAKKSGDQVLVFSHQLPMLDYLEKFIPTSGTIKCARLDGTTKMTGRLDLIKEFNKGKYDVFLISTRAGGLGLNIASANRVILVDFQFNPSHEEQAVGRAYRIGQQKDVFVYHLVTAGTYEDKLHHVTIFKRQLASRVVDNKNPNRFASKVSEYLFEPREVEQEPLDGFIGKDKIMDLVIQGELGTLVRSLQTAETMHAEKEERLTEEEEKEVEEMMLDDKLRKTDRQAWHARNAPSAIQGLPAFHLPSASAPTLKYTGPSLQHQGNQTQVQAGATLLSDRHPGGRSAANTENANGPRAVAAPVLPSWMKSSDLQASQRAQNTNRRPIAHSTRSPTLMTASSRQHQGLQQVQERSPNISSSHHPRLSHKTQRQQEVQPTQLISPLVAGMIAKNAEPHLGFQSTPSRNIAFEVGHAPPFPLSRAASVPAGGDDFIGDGGGRARQVNASRTLPMVRTADLWDDNQARLRKLEFLNRHESKREKGESDRDDQLG